MVPLNITREDGILYLTIMKSGTRKAETRLSFQRFPVSQKFRVLYHLSACGRQCEGYWTQPRVVALAYPKDSR